MNETIDEKRRRMAGYMFAVARLLCGEQTDYQAFIDRINLMISGSAANLPTLQHWAAHVRQGGRPILHFSPTREVAVPLVALVAQVGERMHVVESCALWMGRGDERAQLVPDTFAAGSFTFDEDLRLRHSARAPVRDPDRALAGMGCAYGRLIELELEHRRRGGHLPVPSFLPKAA